MTEPQALLQLSQLQQDEYWMGRALALAEQGAARGEVPVGAIVVKDGTAIAEAYNQPIGSCDPSAHAEIVAMRQAGQALGNYRLLDCSLYVTLEPCSMCAGALVHARIKRLIYAATEPKAGVINSRAQFLDSPFLNTTIEVSAELMAEQ
ncbi:MAG: tRNA adenosine(34) deaminase TadA, partial [Cellvibrionaceae bacterium]|nr:tRNA adenosine(34) deaminase TadA [Cellvibrionaceae bacterium]